MAPPPGRILYANGPAFLDENAGGVRASDHGQVRPMADGREIRYRAARPPSSGDGAIQHAKTLLRGAIEVLRAWKTCLDACRDPGLSERVFAMHPRHLQRTVSGMVCICAAAMSLGPQEIRKHLGPGPALIAELRPAIVVGRHAANIDRRVDGAQPPSTRPRGQ